MGVLLPIPDPGRRYDAGGSGWVRVMCWAIMLDWGGGTYKCLQGKEIGVVVKPSKAVETVGVSWLGWQSQMGPLLIVFAISNLQVLPLRETKMVCTSAIRCGLVGLSMEQKWEWVRGSAATWMGRLRQ